MYCYCYNRTIAAAGNNPLQRKQPLTAATQVAFKNCTLFKDCRTEIDVIINTYVQFDRIE